MKKSDSALMELLIKKLDRLDERLDVMSTTLTRNTDSLELHIKRTDILETKLEPVEKHVERVQAWAVGLAWLCGAAVTVLGVLKTLAVI